MLRGIRLATTSEVPPSAPSTRTLVKALTGETARLYMEQGLLRGSPTLHGALAASHLPQVMRAACRSGVIARKLTHR
jgi:hypothetical protein